MESERRARTPEPRVAELLEADEESPWYIKPEREQARAPDVHHDLAPDDPGPIILALQRIWGRAPLSRSSIDDEPRHPREDKPSRVGMYWRRSSIDDGCAHVLCHKCLPALPGTDEFRAARFHPMYRSSCACEFCGGFGTTSPGGAS